MNRAPISQRLVPLALLLAACVVFTPTAASAASSQATSEPLSSEQAVQPDAVTLYPAGARVSANSLVQVVNGSVSCMLPAGVRPDSVALTVDGRTVTSMTVKPVAGSDSAPVLRLREAFEAVRDAVIADEGALEALKAQRNLWTKPDVKMTQPAEVEQLGKLVGERLSAIYVEQAKTEARLERTRAERDRLQQELEAAGGHAATRLRLHAEVTPPVPGEVRATLTYFMNNCGWRPTYRLEADPASQTVRMIQEAEVRQGSGVHWTGVRLTLATADPGTGLAPSPLAPWMIRNQPRPQPRAMQANEFKMSASRMMDAEELVVPLPAEREHTSFSSWDIGSRDVLAGTPQRLTLQREAWPAVFTSVARPARDSRVYLRARVTLPEPRALPAGKAIWNVDGETVGNGTFSLVGDEAELFFGVDPRITTKMQLNTRQSGRKGFVDRRQTRVWNWSIEVKNAHTRPVTVRIEDAQPQAGHEAITIGAQSEPVPVVEEQAYVWVLELPANTTKTIQHTVTVSAPEDMQLDERR